MPYKDKVVKNLKAKERRQKNPEVYYSGNNRYAQTDKGKFARLHQKASSRNIDVSITFDEYKSLICMPCHYCNGELTKTGYSLDRKDNNLSYSVNNVVTCCFTCNRIKGCDLSYREMVVGMNAINKYRTNGDICQGDD